MLVGFAASSRTLRQAPRILYKPVVFNAEKPMLTIKIQGNNFSNLAEFYDEVERKMTSGLDWKIGRNLNAFNDVLRGGFGVHDCDEDYKLIWENSQKSESELKEFPTIIEMITENEYAKFELK
jgi:RNAse (barnase) inhibitor barstar